MSLTEPHTTGTPPRNSDKTAAFIGAVGRMLIRAGVLIFAFALFQLWGTGFAESRAQSNLSDALEGITEEKADAVTQFLKTAADPSPPSSPNVPSFDQNAPGNPPSATSFADDGPIMVPADLDAVFFPESGSELVRIVAPDAGIDKVVVEGVDVPSLRTGPGHYQDTALPGTAGNAAIAGHRTTYGAPFHNIDRLEPGDPITVVGPFGTTVYEVLAQPRQDLTGICSRPDQLGPETFGVDPASTSAAKGYFIVTPNDSCVVDDQGDDRITLTACHPKYSARQRIIVTARKVSAERLVDIDEFTSPKHPATSTQPTEDLVPEGAGTEATATGSLVPSDKPAPGVKSAPNLESVVPQTQTTQPETTQDLTDLTDLTEGLGWDFDALPRALLAAAMMALLWTAANVSRRKTGNYNGYALLILPFLLATYVAFAAVDQVLPAI